MDSTKLLAEKLTLAREVSLLKPEVEHLRSQTLSHQSLLREKLSLQRQLSTLQVELDNEKRSSRRFAIKESVMEEEDARLKSQTETLCADLSKERRERQKAEREAQKASVDGENKMRAVDSRLEAFKSKLRLTKEQLKEAQTELQEVRACNSRSANLGALTTQLPNPRKRAAQRNEDMMIGTPGDLPAAKKWKGASTALGEKSTFSITPFINRTASAAIGSPNPKDNGQGDTEVAQSPAAIRCGSDRSEASSAVATHGAAAQRGGSETVENITRRGAHESKKATKLNSKAPTPRKPNAVPKMAQVGERDIETTILGEFAGLVADKGIIREGQRVKLKRKILRNSPGENLFHDDNDGSSGDRRLGGGVTNSGMLNLGNLGAPRLTARKALGVGSNFGLISPLRKEKKVSAII